MAIKIQIIGKKNYTERLIKQPNIESNDQIVTHNDEITALHYAAENLPDIILVDYHISNQDAADLISFLFKKSPASKIIVFGSKLTQTEILNCLLAGANGYLDQTTIEQHINKAIRVVLDGEIWITRKMTTLLLERLRNL